jgi:trehalose 6-phosphate synthase/phosphatase
MFAALRDKGYTIKVGSGNTIAKFTLLSQKDVFPLLSRMAAATLKAPVG